MSADRSRGDTPALAPNDHDDYRALLEDSQRGIDNAKAFLLAIRASAAAASNKELRDNAGLTKALLDETTARLEQVWDEFQRIHKR
jgi:hypothetical protein